MPNRSKICTLSVVMAALLALAATPPDRFEKVGRKVVKSLNAQNAEALYALFAPVMKKALPLGKTRVFLQGLLSQKGKIEKGGEPRISGSTALIRLDCERGALTMRLTLDEKDRITGLRFQEAPPETPVPKRNTIPMRLPFNGEWFVFWGGATEEENYHVTTPSQRRELLEESHAAAHDALGEDEAGSGERGDRLLKFRWKSNGSEDNLQ